MHTRPAIERRVTPWKALWFESPTHTHVRIWKEFDGRQWWQMHEWRHVDGSTDADGWIHSGRGWQQAGEPTDETAPGDVPALTPEEIAYLIDRLAGVNDPVGASALAKLNKMKGISE